MKSDVSMLCIASVEHLHWEACKVSETFTSPFNPVRPSIYLMGFTPYLWDMYAVPGSSSIDYCVVVPVEESIGSFHY